MINQKTSSILLYIFTVFFTFQIDRVTKELALSKAQVPYPVNQFLSFELVINRGVTNGLLYSESDGWFMLLTALIMCIIFGLAFYAFRRLMMGKNIIGELLVLTGAVSNVFDRFVYKGVVDFIHLSLGSYSFPIFNIADMLIVIGVAIILFHHFKE